MKLSFSSRQTEKNVIIRIAIFLHKYNNCFLFVPVGRRLVSQRLIRKLVDSHGSAETRSLSRRDPATLLM